MNLLIAGGLLVIGVIMLVALFFVIRSEPVTKKDANLSATAPIVQKTSDKLADADAHSSTVQVPPTPNLSTQSPDGEHLASEWHPSTNGQFYELKNELHTLHDQAQELETRLGTLIAMVERIDQAQNGRFPIEGQISDAAGNQAIH